jgi:hypothetical protein
VLQGKSEQGMASLSLVPENEELATASCGYNLYSKLMSPSSNTSTYETTISDKHDVDSLGLAIGISKIRLR